MIEIHELRILWKVNRPEAYVFLTTCLTILATDLIVGVPVGLTVTLIYFVAEMSRLSVKEYGPRRDATTGPEDLTSAVEDCPVIRVVEIDGPLFFASGAHIENLVERISRYPSVIIDMGGVTFVDATGWTLLEDAVAELNAKGSSVALANVAPSLAGRLEHLPVDVLPTLRACRVHGGFAAAVSDAASRVDPDRLCEACRPTGSCEAAGTLAAGGRGRSTVIA